MSLQKLYPLQMNSALNSMPSAGSIIARSDPGRDSRQGCYGLLLAALAAQLLLLWFAMPLSEIASGNWFFHIDNPFHIYQLELGRALQEDGRLLGYDPFFGAGHIAGLSSNVSARFTLAFAALLPMTVPIATVYAVYVLVCSLAVPVSLWGLGQLLNWSYWHKVCAIAIGLLLWWVGVFHWYHTAGMVSFVCACYLAPLYAIWVYSMCHPGTPLRPIQLVLAGLAGGVCMWLHPLFCIPVATLCLSFVILDAPRPPLLPLIGRSAFIALVVILLSLPWLLALARAGNQVSDDHGYQRAVGLGFLFNSLGFGTGGALGATINFLLFGLCLLGVWLRFAGQKMIIKAFLYSGLGLLLFAAFAGSSSTLSYVQPNRFLGPAYLLMGMAAAFHAVSLVDWAIMRFGRLGRAAMFTMGAVILLFFARELIRETTPGAHQHHGKAPPEIGPPPEEVAQLANWISTNTTTDARILFETSLGRVHGGGHVAGYLASSTKREFMGAAYPYFLPQLSCWDKSCFNRPIGKMSIEHFNSAVGTYNVGWVVAHSSELKSFLSQLPNIKALQTVGGVAIYKVDGPRSYVLTGSARLVARDFNRLEFADVVGQSITLRYNWVKGLETVPPSVIEAYQWSPDFPPLVRVRNPPANFILRLAK